MAATTTAESTPAAAAPAPAVAAATETPAAPADAETAPEVEGARVYVGNLSFTATEEQVTAHFAKVGGDIVSVILPTRHKSRRPAGYAFVTFKDEADAQKAVETLNETEIGERKIQLEVARSKEENAERKSAVLEKRREAKAAKEPKPVATDADAAATTEGEDTAEKAAKPKKAKKAGRRRGPEDGEETVETEAAAPAATKTKKPKAPKAAQEGATNGDAAEKKESTPRKPRLQLTGENSKTTVFVANLPFTIDDEALAALFTDVSIKVKSAHVIRGLRRLPGRRPFRGSKGFGFVELEDQSQQDEAVEKINGSAIGDRKITAKVAQEMKPIEELVAEASKDDQPETAAAPAAAAATEAAAPATASA